MSAPALVACPMMVVQLRPPACAVRPSPETLAIVVAPGILDVRAAPLRLAVKPC